MERCLVLERGLVLELGLLGTRLYERGLLPNVDDDPREHEALQGRRGIEGAGRGIGGRIAFVSRGGALDRGGKRFTGLNGLKEPLLAATQTMTVQSAAAADQQRPIG